MMMTRVVVLCVAALLVACAGLLGPSYDQEVAAIKARLLVLVEEERAKGAAANQDTIHRALETIEITATNARDMIKSSGGSGEPVTGTIID